MPVARWAPYASTRNTHRAESKSVHTEIPTEGKLPRLGRDGLTTWGCGRFALHGVYLCPLDSFAAGMVTILSPFARCSPCLVVVVQRQPNPVVKLALGSHSLSVDINIPSVMSSLHDHGLATPASQRSIVDRRVDAAHDSLPAHTDTHLSPDHERDTAKHPLFLDLSSVS